MSHPLRLLIVEDSEDDAELLLRELRRADYTVTWERVDTPEAMRAALARQPWDVVTSDHAMPRFSAPAALALLKATHPDLPFIIVSNEINLNLAVSLMKAGAQDYIQKRELAKVGPAIQRELREVEMRRKRQQAEAAQHESESKYRGVFEVVADALFIIDQVTGAILDVNPAACQLYGYTRQEMLRRKNTDMSAEPEKTAHALQTELNRIAPRYHRKKDGTRFPVDITASYYTVGERRLSLVAIRDMTVRVDFETALRESEQKYRDLAALVPEATFEAELSGRLIFVNQRALEMGGYTQADFEQGLNFYDLVAPEDHAALRANLDRRMGGTPNPHAHYRIQRKDGARLLAEVSATLVWRHDKPVGLRGVVRDLSEKNQLERQLSEARTLLEAALEQSPVPMVLVTAAGQTIQVVNSACLKFLGLGEKPSPVGQSLQAFTPNWQEYDTQGSPIRLQAMPLAQALQGQTTRNAEYRVVRADGTIAWKLASATPIYGPTGELLAAFSVFFDITALKRIEELSQAQNEELLAQNEELQAQEEALRQTDRELRESQERYRMLFEHAAEGIAVCQDNHFRFINPVMAQLFGYTWEVLATRDLISFVHPDDRASVAQHYTQSLAAGPRPTAIDFRIINDRGEVIWLQANGVRIEWEGAPALLMFYTNITARKQTEAALRESEEQMRQITSSLREAVWLRDTQTLAMLYINPAYETIWGRTRESLYQHPTSFLDAVHADDLGRLQRAIQAQSQGKYFNEEYRVWRPDGTQRWVWGRTFPVRDEAGQVYRIVAVAEDITARKQTEAALRESEEQLRQITTSLHEAVWLRDSETRRLLYINPAYETIWGRTCEYFYQNPESLIDTVYPGDRDRYTQAVLNRARGIPFNEDYRIMRPDGSLRWIHGRTFPVQNEAGQTYRMVAIAEDITDRKLAEAGLEAQQRYDRLLSHLSTRFFSLAAGAIETEIEQGLKQVAEFLGIERASLFEIASDQLSFRLSASYVAPGYPPAETELLHSAFPWYVDQLRRGEVMAVERLNQAPTSASPEKDYSDQIHLKSTLAIPLSAGGGSWGAFTFATFRQEHAWPPEQIVFLRLVGEVFANALVRKQAEAQLQQERGLFIAGPVVVIKWGNAPGWPVEYVSPNLVTQFGYAPADFTSGRLTYGQRIHPDDQARVTAEDQAYRQQGADWFEQEYRLARADGQYRWVHNFTRVHRDAAGAITHYDAYLSDITARKEAEEEIRQRNRELETVGRLISAIATNLNLPEILEQALRGALELAELEGGTLCLVNAEHQTLTLSVARNTSPEMYTDLASQAIKVGDCLCGHTAQTGEPLILWDNASESGYATREALRAEGLRFHASFPLAVKGQVIGILCVFARSAARPSARTLALLQQLCGPIALAIDNARLYEQAQHHAAELEQHVLERTVELAATNQELEAFSYSVAHDLRAPLRSIDGYSQALLEDYAEAVGPEGSRHLQRIRAASAHMGLLIEDLLELSRLTRGELNRSLLDLSAIAQAIADDLQQREPRRAAECVIAEGIVVRADERLMRAVLENLLSNAWKFTARRAPARIEFGEYRVPTGDGLEERVYFVRDNGAGFDMSQVDRLFTAFQRLHAGDEFPGTGIGLATVKRIIHRHGGRVWAEGAVEQGATFYFTL